MNLKTRDEPNFLQTLLLESVHTLTKQSPTQKHNIASRKLLLSGQNSNYHHTKRGEIRKRRLLVVICLNAREQNKEMISKTEAKRRKLKQTPESKTETKTQTISENCRPQKHKSEERSRNFATKIMSKEGNR